MAQQTSVPTTWPGAFGLFKYSKEAVSRNWVTILALFVLPIAFSFLGNTMASSGSHAQKIFMELIVQIIASVLTIALIATLLSSVSGKSVELKDAFSTITPMMFVWFVVGEIISAILLALSFICLIVPFFFVAPRLALVQYFIVDKKMDAIQAIEASWNATRGNIGKVWGIWGVLFLFAILCVVIVGIPLLFLFQAAPVILYLFLTKQR